MSACGWVAHRKPLQRLCATEAKKAFTRCRLFPRPYLEDGERHPGLGEEAGGNAQRHFSLGRTQPLQSCAVPVVCTFCMRCTYQQIDAGTQVNLLTRNTAPLCNHTFLMLMLHDLQISIQEPQDDAHLHTAAVSGRVAAAPWPQMAQHCRSASSCWRCLAASPGAARHVDRHSPIAGAAR